MGRLPEGNVTYGETSGTPNKKGLMHPWSQFLRDLTIYRQDGRRLTDSEIKLCVADAQSSRRILEKAEKGSEEFKDAQKKNQETETAIFNSVFGLIPHFLKNPYDIPGEELVGEVFEIIHRAIYSFNLQDEREVEFSNYVAQSIRMTLKSLRTYADPGQSIYLPAHTEDFRRRMYRKWEKLCQSLGHEPTLDELAAYLAGSEKIPYEKVYELIQAVRRVDLRVPLDEHVNLSRIKSCQSNTNLAIKDIAPSEDEPLEQRVVLAETRAQFEELMRRKLSPRERQIIRARFGFDNDEPKTSKEIGRTFGVTRERIRQIEAKSLRKLRQSSHSSKLRDYLE